MKQRWQDRIKILLPAAPIYDNWGHLLPEKWEEYCQIWADVRPVLGCDISAIVSVRDPLDFDSEIQLEWNGARWKLIQGPVFCTKTRVAQFKMVRIKTLPDKGETA